MAAISSASSATPSQAISVVCFRPVSPLTKYACASADSTGSVASFEPMLTCRKSASAALASAAALITSVDDVFGDRGVRVVARNDVVVGHEASLARANLSEVAPRHGKASHLGRHPADRTSEGTSARHAPSPIGRRRTVPVSAAMSPARLRRRRHGSFARAGAKIQAP